MEKRKVFILGLDGFSYDYFSYLLSNNYLKNFSRICEESSYGPLESTYPANSFPAWTSFMTGVNPGKHSIFYPVVYQGDNSYSGELFQSTQIKVPTLFEILSERDYSVGIINQPMTYPPFEVNGFLISGFAPENSQYTYPTSVQEFIEEKFPKYKLHIKREHQPKDSLRNAKNNMLIIERLSNSLFKRKSIDIKCVIITEIDRISHWYWDDKEIIDEIYHTADEIVGRMFDKYGNDHHFIILSDHGFNIGKSIFYPNYWLEKEGYLKRARKRKRLQDNYLILRGLRAINKIFKKMRITRSFDMSEEIDWERTQVFFRNDFGFRWNLVGRERRGVLLEKDRIKLESEVFNKLLEVEDPYSDGKRMFSQVLKKEDIYHGEHARYASDFFLDFNYHYCRCISSDLFSKKMVLPNRNEPGKHSKYGIVLFSGVGINKSKIVNNMRITDIVTNIFVLLNEPIPSHWDGHVIPDLFSNQQVIRNISYLEDDISKRKTGTTKDSNEIIDRLQGLGYI
jgi:predicted AlkP superfamily phosphohydrolase/phosphomutase